MFVDLNYMHMKAIAKMQVFPESEFGVLVMFTLNTKIDTIVDAICNNLIITHPQINIFHQRMKRCVNISGPCGNEFVKTITNFIEQMEDAYTAMEKLLAIQKDINAGE